MWKFGHMGLLGWLLGQIEDEGNLKIVLFSYIYVSLSKDVEWFSEPVENSVDGNIQHFMDVLSKVQSDRV